MKINQKILEYIEAIDTSTISNQRKIELSLLSQYILNKRGKTINLNFICTHNSRRSHLCQIWAQTMASYFKVNNLFAYSGGTESTAIYKTVLFVLEDIGFGVNKISESSNPIYAIRFDEVSSPIIGFSKKIDNEYNPKEEFCAILTCDSANESCPIVVGAEARIPILFQDPKVFDNSEFEILKYEERCRQVATDMYYIFSQI
jgi:arsenate reductase